MINIPIDKEAIAAFCAERGIRKLALFGSVTRDDFTPESDVDVYVEFYPDKIPGLEFFQMEIDLAEMFGRKVDLNTYKFLSPYFRDDVVAKAEVIYVAS